MGKWDRKVNQAINCLKTMANVNGQSRRQRRRQRRQDVRAYLRRLGGRCRRSGSRQGRRSEAQSPLQQAAPQCHAAVELLARRRMFQELQEAFCSPRKQAASRLGRAAVGFAGLGGSLSRGPCKLQNVWVNTTVNVTTTAAIAQAQLGEVGTRRPTCVPSLPAAAGANLAHATQPSYMLLLLLPSFLQPNCLSAA